MNQSEYEKILTDAIQGEIDAQHFYQDAAQSVQDPFLKDLFTSFVAEEKKHETILKGFITNIPEKLPFDEARDYNVAQTVNPPKVSTDMKPVDAFALAMKKEEEAMHHYNNLANGCTAPEQKRIFQELAAMEREHKFKMEKAFVDIGYPEVW